MFSGEQIPDDEEAPACSLVSRHRKRVVSAWSPPAGRPAIPVCVAVFNEALVVFLKSCKTLRVTPPRPPAVPLLSRSCQPVKSAVATACVCEAGSASDVSASMTRDLRRPDARAVTLQLSEQISAPLSPRRPLFKHLLSRHQVVRGRVSHAAVMFVLMLEQSCSIKQSKHSGILILPCRSKRE